MKGEYSSCNFCHKRFFIKFFGQKYCNTTCRNKYHAENGYKKVVFNIKTCLQCKKRYKPKTHNQKYCDNKCTNLAYTGHGLNINTGKIGAISEMLVAVDLMKRGYEVFRAVSQSSSCDLYALKDGKAIKFEVRTGQERPDGSLSYPRVRFRADCFAVCVIKDNKVIYQPSLESF